MESPRPYNPTVPGHGFVGYERLRRQLLNGFVNGNSFAVLGGRRCGKTSLLIQIERDVRKQGLAPFTPLPRRLSMLKLGAVTPERLFEKIYLLVVEGVPEAPPWTTPQPGRAYDHFLKQLGEAKAALEAAHGPRWLVLLLIDELDAAVKKLPDDQFFQNLRHLLMEEEKTRFRLVATGVDLSNLINAGSSPLNNLRHKYLTRLTVPQTDELIGHGFPDGLPPSLRENLLLRTGRHPFLLQGILDKLWDEQPDLNPETLKRETRAFLREHQTFTHWQEAFTPAADAVYRCLAQTPHGKLIVQELRKQMAPDLRHEWEEGITFLSYHGIVDDTDPDVPHLVGTLFRDWYRQRFLDEVDPSASEPRKIRVFNSYAHEDEAQRDRLEKHLTILKRQKVIQTWHDRKILPGQNWADQIDQNLEEADIILLLISADFIASDYCYEIEVRRALERHEAGEAVVVPIILRPVDWTDAPFARLQALPKDAKPVETWTIKEQAWADVAEGIKRLANELREPLRHPDGN